MTHQPSPASDAPVSRCRWAETSPLLRAYHDEEWGVPVHESRMLWEMLMLDGFQAGLSWLTVLRRRDGFRKAFAEFDPVQVARFGEADVERLMLDPGIIRARAKIQATIGNARAYLAMQAQGRIFPRSAGGWCPVRRSTIQPGRCWLSRPHHRRFQKPSRRGASSLSAP